MRRDRGRLAVIEKAHEQFEAALGALAQEALRPLGATPDDVQLARALTDVRVWEAMRERGLDHDPAIDLASRTLLCALPDRAARPGRTA